VFQRIIEQHRGDCFTAALASILELRYEDVPCFLAEAVDAGQPHRWHAAMITWLQALGLRLHQVAWKDFNDWRGVDGALALLSVPSQRFPGGSHAVVCTWVSEGGGSTMRIIHDPNQENAPYPRDVEPTFVKFLVPLIPGAPAQDLPAAAAAARAVIQAPVHLAAPPG